MPIGTPFFDAFIARLQEWVDDLDLTPAMLESWVYMAEERFNNELRILEMVQTRGVMLMDQCVPFPDDWLELISVRYVGSSLPLRYVSSDEFWRLRSSAEYNPYGASSTAITYLDPVTGVPLGPVPHQPAFIDYPGHSGSRLSSAQNCYTYLGKTLFVHPTVATPSADIDPTHVQLAYYSKLPPLAEATAPTPLFQRAPKLYTYGALSMSAPYLVEDQRAMIWDGNVTALIKSMNDSSRPERIVSSPILMQVRTFG